jgi:hypothetical protein
VTQQSPAEGDLLISRRAEDGKFEISVVPRRPQLVAPTRKDAIEQAHAFAAKNGTSVWLTDSNGRTVPAPRPSGLRDVSVSPRSSPRRRVDR